MFGGDLGREIVCARRIEIEAHGGVGIPGRVVGIPLKEDVGTLL